MAALRTITPRLLVPQALLGGTAIMLGGTTRDLRNRHRAELLLLGAGAIAVFLSFHTNPGTTMIWWFMD